MELANYKKTQSLSLEGLIKIKYTSLQQGSQLSAGLSSNPLAEEELWIDKKWVRETRRVESGAYPPRRTDMTVPKRPTTSKPIMARMGGNPPGRSAWVSSKIGCTTGSAGVNVGRRVGGAPPILNWAASVGSIVAVTRGVGVGGGSMIGSKR